MGTRSICLHSFHSSIDEIKRRASRKRKLHVETHTKQRKKMNENTLRDTENKRTTEQTNDEEKKEIKYHTYNIKTNCGIVE